MPRISEPTVAEHRAARRAALLDAAASIVVQRGVDAVRPGPVTSRAGLARSSFYEYFTSSEDLVSALTARAFEEWGHDLRDALERAEPGLPRLRRYVEVSLAMVEDGSHGLAAALQRADPTAEQRDRIMAMHEAILRPLVRVLGEAGVRDPRSAAPLVRAVLGVAVRQVAADRPASEVADEVFGLLTRGLDRDG